MPTFSYIDKLGAKKTVDATDPNTALRTAGDIASDSGVQLQSEKAVPSPYTDRVNGISRNPDVPNADGSAYGSLADRYKTSDRLTKGLGEVDAISALTPAPDQAAINANEAARVQSIINAINQKYASVEARDTETADLLNRERRASNVMRGLTGSDTGTSRTIETVKAGQQIKDLTAKSKGAEVQAALTNSQDRASAEFKAQKDAFILASKDKLTAEQGVRDRIQKDAFNEISVLAGSKSWDDLMQQNPKLLGQYSEETGLNETALKALFLKETEKNWDKIKEVDGVGKQTFIYKNKATGEIKTEDIATPEGYKFVSSVGNDGAFINEQTRDIQYINGPKTAKTSTTPEISAPASGGQTPAQTRSLAQAGLSGIQPQDKNYFLNTDPAFQKEWIRNYSTTKTNPPTIKEAYEAWYAQKSGASGGGA